MPNSATLTVWGLLTYNEDLFENIVLPNDVDAGLVVSNIALECSELELLYPDWDFMHDFAIPVWSAAELPTWDHVAEMAALQYNPIENYDRHESEITGRDRNLDKRRTTSDSETASGISHSDQENSQNTTGSDNSISQASHNVTGYNTDTPVTENTDNSSGAGSRSEAISGSVKNNTGSSSELSRDGTDNTTEGETENLVRSSHIHGNIGVTTVAQMMAGELETYPKINVVNYITESFKRRFCILVY